MKFLNDDFMLHNEVAVKLYHEYAENLPIIDYHCHLSAKLIAEDYKFRNATDLFLGGDHYKWRGMRSNGVEEKYITGDASDYEKFVKWAETIPYCLGNPLYHWMHLELKKYFGITEPFSPNNVEEVWNKCNAMLSDDSYSAQNLIIRSNVEALCTTDDPTDDLYYHKLLKQQGFPVKVLPTFRPDKAVDISNPAFIPYMKQAEISTYNGLCKWIVSRIQYFNEAGCKLSDHGLGRCPYGTLNPEKVFNKRMNGEQITQEEADSFSAAVIKICGEEYSRLGWTMQLHMGATRSNNTRMFRSIGADTGFDSINDLCVSEPLSRLLDSMDVEDKLPKTILYTLNPKDNYVLGTMIGNFQSAPYKSKLQFGAGWWFNDQRDGMTEQMKALANLGLLSRFVGMLTDSRSFVSYTRHEYFRRIMCNLIGTWVTDGEYPEDYKILGEIVQNISYYNAKNYFEF